MTAKRFGWLAASTLAVALLGVLVAVNWTPAPHAVSTAGATAITDIQVADRNPSPFYVSVAPAPSMSLEKLRCEVWRARSATCPDPTTLAQQLWPSLSQSPKTLYVALPEACLTSFGGYGLNVEYFASSRTLTIHCYSAAAWYVAQGPPGVRAVPSIGLVLVGTKQIPPGNLTVVEDYRVEHLLGDDSTQVVLGTAAIS
jgi:hypothetical protein